MYIYINKATTFIDTWTTNIAEGLQIPTREEIENGYIYNPLFQNCIIILISF
jgi:hypothetical protein